MIFLPVAQRELMAAARRKSTFRVRVGTAVVASIITFLMLVFVSATGAGQQSGRFVFDVLLGGCHVFAVLSGMLLTADCISEERRDGTLGLLFLTDLGGLDVVAGKFTGLALNAFYGLAAVFPVMAIAWFMGGVTGSEFTRHALAVLNSLFVCTATGLAVSAGQYRQTRAMGFTLALLGFLYVILPMLGAGLGSLGGASGTFDWIRHLSPLSPTTSAGGTNPINDPYWTALAVSHATGWGLLTMAGWTLKRRWRSDRSGLEEAVRRRPLNRDLLERDPIRALMAAERWPVIAVWSMVAIGVLAVLLVRLLYGGQIPAGVLFPFFMLLTLAAKGLLTWEATLFLSEARRTGALDLLLTTPLRDEEILRSQGAHLRNRYLAPLVSIVALDIACGFMGTGFEFYILLAALGTLLQCFAVSRLATWYALTERHPLVAFGKAFSFAVLIPTVLIFLCCPTLVLPPILAAWAGSKLRLPFRDILVGVRSHWQRRDGWMHASSQTPPPLPMNRVP